VPPCASSKRPGLSLIASAHAPRSWPNSSDSISVPLRMAHHLLTQRGKEMGAQVDGIYWSFVVKSDQPGGPEGLNQGTSMTSSPEKATAGDRRAVPRGGAREFQSL
jgi:hypothetical protein